MVGSRTNIINTLVSLRKDTPCVVAAANLVAGSVASFVKKINSVLLSFKNFDSPISVIGNLLYDSSAPF